MPTSAKGLVNIGLETAGSPGPQTGIIGYQAIASTMTINNQPTFNCRLRVRVYNNTANGTVTINGTDPNGNALAAEVISSANMYAPGPSQQANINWAEYCTVNVYGAGGITSITTTGLTNGTMIVDAIRSGNHAIPSIFKAKKTPNTYSPDESRGVLDRDTRLIHLEANTTIDSIQQVLYPLTSMWFPYMVSNSTPTITTNPASPTVLKASTAIATMSLSSQPNFPGQALIYIITGSSATGSFVVSGTNQYGIAITETVQCPGNGTNGNGSYYSQYIWSAVNASGITTFSGLTGGSLQVNGVYNWLYNFVPGDQVYTAAMEWFTGSESFVYPWTLIQELDIELDPKKPIMLTGKGIAQDQVAIGDRTNNPTTTRTLVNTQPSDTPVGGWQAQCWIDPPGVSLKSTYFGDLINGKVMFKTPVEGGFTMTNSQYFNRQLRGRREVEVDVAIDVLNAAQLEKYRTNSLQYFTFEIYGTNYGNGQSAQWTVSIPFYYTGFEVTAEPSANRVVGNLKFKGVYDSGLGGSFIITIQSQQPPIYPN